MILRTGKWVKEIQASKARLPGVLSTCEAPLSARLVYYHVPRRRFSRRWLLEAQRSGRWGVRMRALTRIRPNKQVRPWSNIAVGDLEDLADLVRRATEKPNRAQRPARRIKSKQWSSDRGTSASNDRDHHIGKVPARDFSLGLHRSCEAKWIIRLPCVFLA